ncbi:MAG: ORF6N domain-containing protein [Prevotella sp.]|nr:ORF6N domain-containing protein [Prevotella sp.]
MRNIQNSNGSFLSDNQFPILYSQVQSHIIEIRHTPVIVDADVAALYGVETKRVNEAVRNNPDKFPEDYMFVLTADELQDLRSKNSSTKVSAKSRSLPKAFTEKGLYMLATILKSQRATEVTFAIIETFAKVRNLKRELKELHKETDASKQKVKMQHFGEVLSDIVMPDLETSETESTLELNFFIGKIKHTVKRVKKNKD